MDTERFWTENNSTELNKQTYLEEYQVFMGRWLWKQVDFICETKTFNPFSIQTFIPSRAEGIYKSLWKVFISQFSKEKNLNEKRVEKNS